MENACREIFLNINRRVRSILFKVKRKYLQLLCRREFLLF